MRGRDSMNMIVVMLAFIIGISIMWGVMIDLFTGHSERAGKVLLITIFVLIAIYLYRTS